MRLDRKIKKVTFLISQHGDNLEDKATVSTIEEIGERINALEYKLDEISMGIST